MAEQPQILLIDDDPELCQLMGEYLSHEGFDLSFAHSAEEALPKLQSAEYSLLILDIMMPGQTGLELLQQIRPAVQTPVIMLTGRGDDVDRILGLEMGADDYLAKPCNPRELVARIRAVLRRAKPAAPAADSQLLSLHGISLDAACREAQIGEEVLPLTSAEFNVLNQLMQHAGQVVSKDILTEKVLHRKLTAYDRAIDVHVSRVRQKIQQYLPQATIIKTVRGEGYLFVADNGGLN